MDDQIEDDGYDQKIGDGSESDGTMTDDRMMTDGDGR